MSDTKKLHPQQWLGRPIVSPEHVQDLETRAAINEFHAKMTRHEAEQKAHDDYVKEHRERAAAHHLAGMKAAMATGNHDDARKHWAMYDLHLKALGKESVGAVPPEVEKRMMEDGGDKPVYKFKAHKGDLYALHEPSKDVAPPQGEPVQKAELAKGDLVKFPGNPAPAQDQGRQAEVVPMHADAEPLFRRGSVVHCPAGYFDNSIRQHDTGVVTHADPHGVQIRWDRNGQTTHHTHGQANHYFKPMMQKAELAKGDLVQFPRERHVKYQELRGFYNRVGQIEAEQNASRKFGEGDRVTHADQRAHPGQGVVIRAMYRDAGPSPLGQLRAGHHYEVQWPDGGVDFHHQDELRPHLTVAKSEAKQCKWRLGERRCQRMVKGDYCHDHVDHWANKIKQKEEPEMEKAELGHIQKPCPLCGDDKKHKNLSAHLEAEHAYEMEHRRKDPDDPVVNELKGVKKADLPATPPVGTAHLQAPQLHSTVEGFVGALKGLPKGSPERGKFITAHMNHGPFLTALKTHPQGQQVHAMLTQHLNSRANAGVQPGKTVTVVKAEQLETVEAARSLLAGLRDLLKRKLTKAEKTEDLPALAALIKALTQ